VTEDAIIGAQDISPIYAIPLNLHEQGLDQIVLNVLGIDAPPADLDEWRDLVERMRRPREEVRVAAIGKYVAHEDAYKSINEAFEHAGVANDCKVRLEWIDSEQFEKGIPPEEVLKDFDGVLIGPGFGKRGVEGKVRAVHYVRENKKPFLGICLGMQIACIEIARNLLGLKEANSTEFDAMTPHPVISLLTEQKGIKEVGAERLAVVTAPHLDSTRTPRTWCPPNPTSGQTRSSSGSSAGRMPLSLSSTWSNWIRPLTISSLTSVGTGIVVATDRQTMALKNAGPII